MLKLSDFHQGVIVGVASVLCAEIIAALYWWQALAAAARRAIEIVTG